MSNYTNPAPRNWFLAQRFAYIEAHVARHGHITRRVIAEKFRISMAQASADFTAYLSANPCALCYNLQAKRYERGRTPRQCYTLEAWPEFSTARAKRN